MFLKSFQVVVDLYRATDSLGTYSVARLLTSDEKFSNQVDGGFDALMQMAFRLLHASKAVWPMLTMLHGKVTFVNALQSIKAYSPRLTRLSGRLSSDRLVQLLKAPSAMLVMPAGRFRCSRAVQPLKAYPPKRVTWAGISKVVNPVQP